MLARTKRGKKVALDLVKGSDQREIFKYKWEKAKMIKLSMEYAILSNISKAQPFFIKVLQVEAFGNYLV